jgi:hypothetical protein
MMLFAFYGRVSTEDQQDPSPAVPQGRQGQRVLVARLDPHGSGRVHEQQDDRSITPRVPQRIGDQLARDLRSPARQPGPDPTQRRSRAPTAGPGARHAGHVAPTSRANMCHWT